MTSSKMWKAIMGGLVVIALVIPHAEMALASTGTWSAKAPMLAARYGLGIGVVNGIPYAVGGFNGSAYVGTVEAYDPSTNTWSAKAPMPTPRCCAGITVVNGILYAVGGVSTGLLNTVEAYDPSTNTWSAKAPMPTARSGLATGAVNGMLYAVGGVSTGLLTTVEAYDPGTDTWTTKASMPTARADLAIGVANGIVYAVGGTAGGVGGMLNTVEAYDPSTGTWTAKASMPTARTNLGVGVVGAILYGVGGAAGSDLTTVEAYDPSTNTWSTDASMPTARQGLGIGVVNGTLFAVGGFNGTAGILGTNEAFTPVAPSTAFEAFAVRVEIVPSAEAFAVRGVFTLGAGGAINPPADTVTVRLGSASITIPAGSFQKWTDQEDVVFFFFKVLNDVPVEGLIVPLGGNRFAFEIGAAGVSGLPSANPVTVMLTIGNNTGSVSVDASFGG